MLSSQASETFFKLHEIIIGVLLCAGLLIWGLRKLTQECCDWYDEFQERRNRWREKKNSGADTMA
jgi:hypothetical protein